MSNDTEIENPSKLTEVANTYAPSIKAYFTGMRFIQNVTHSAQLNFKKCALYIAQYDIGNVVHKIEKLMAMVEGDYGAESVHFNLNGNPVICSRFFCSTGNPDGFWNFQVGPVSITLKPEEIVIFVNELKLLQKEICDPLFSAKQNMSLDVDNLDESNPSQVEACMEQAENMVNRFQKTEYKLVKPGRFVGINSLHNMSTRVSLSFNNCAISISEHETNYAVHQIKKLMAMVEDEWASENVPLNMASIPVLCSRMFSNSKWHNASPQQVPLMGERFHLLIGPISIPLMPEDITVFIEELKSLDKQFRQMNATAD